MRDESHHAASGEELSNRSVQIMLEQAAQGLAVARDELAQDQDRGLFRSVGHVVGKIAKAFSRDRGRTPAAELEHDQGR
jgi:hypothetical protein